MEGVDDVGGKIVGAPLITAPYDDSTFEVFGDKTIADGKTIRGIPVILGDRRGFDEADDVFFCKSDECGRNRRRER